MFRGRTAGTCFIIFVWLYVKLWISPIKQNIVEYLPWARESHVIWSGSSSAAWPAGWASAVQQSICHPGCRPLNWVNINKPNAAVVEALAPEADFLSQDLRYIRKRSERRRQQGITDEFVYFCLCSWCCTPAHAGKAMHRTCIDKYLSHGILHASNHSCAGKSKLLRVQIPPLEEYPHVRFIDAWHTRLNLLSVWCSAFKMKM